MSHIRHTLRAHPLMVVYAVLAVPVLIILQIVMLR